MDHLQYFFSLPFLLSSILFLIIISLKQLKSLGGIIINGRKSSKLALPPGPWRLPLIGSIHHLVGSPPHRRFRELSLRHGPLMHLQLGQVSTVVVSSAQVAREVLKTHDLVFAYRPRLPGSDLVFYGPSNIVFSPIGDYWKLIRKICSQELLNATRVRSLKALWEKEVSSLMKSLSVEAESCTNLTEKVFATVCGVTSKSAFGGKHKGQLEAILSVAEMIMKSSQEVNVSHLFPSWKWLHVITGVTRKIEEMHRKVDLVLENIILGEDIGDDDEEGGQCLLSALLSVKERGDLTMDNVKAVMLDVIIGGIESPSTLVEWAMVEMLRKPRVMRRAQAEVRQVFRNKGYIDESGLEELEYLKAVIKETLRLHPPAPFLGPRQSAETCEINGYTVPFGTQVLVNAWAIGRDPNYWSSSAEDFFPERFLNCSIDYKGFNFEYIPFGAGKRICPGMLFGPAIGEIILAHLLCYFDWELPSGTTPENLDMSEIVGTTMRRKTDLILVPISYNPSTF